MSAAASYRLFLPPGWRQLPLDDSAGTVIDGILDEVFAGVPRDTATPWRSEVRKMLLSQVDTGRRAGGLDLYLPIDAQRGRPARGAGPGAGSRSGADRGSACGAAARRARA